MTRPVRRPSRQLRVLVLVHESLIPPERASSREVKGAEWKTEYDVIHALRGLGHEPQPVGVGSDLGRAAQRHPGVQARHRLQPRGGLRRRVHLGRQRGGLSRAPEDALHGLQLAGPRALPRQGHRQEGALLPPRAPGRLRGVRPRAQGRAGPAGCPSPSSSSRSPSTPPSASPRPRWWRTRRSCRSGCASSTRASAPTPWSSATSRGVSSTWASWATSGCRCCRIWELSFDDLPEESRKIATERLKWSLTYRKKHAIVSGPAREMPEKVAARIRSICRRVYRSLMLSGYARIDLRLSEDGQPYRPRGQPQPAALRRRRLRGFGAGGGPLLRVGDPAHPGPRPALRAHAPELIGASARENRTSTARASGSWKAARASASAATSFFVRAVKGAKGATVTVARPFLTSTFQVPATNPSTSTVAAMRRAERKTRGRWALATNRSSARVAMRLSYSGTKRTGAGTSASGRGALGRSKSSRPRLVPEAHQAWAQPVDRLGQGGQARPGLHVPDAGGTVGGQVPQHERVGGRGLEGNEAPDPIVGQGEAGLRGERPGRVALRHHDEGQRHAHRVSHCALVRLRVGALQKVAQVLEGERALGQEIAGLDRQPVHGKLGAPPARIERIPPPGRSGSRDAASRSPSR